MQRHNLNISWVCLSMLGFTFACADPSRVDSQASGSTAETGDAGAAEADAGEGAESMAETSGVDAGGDGDGDSGGGGDGDGDGDDGDKVPIDESNSGDGDGDGDGDPMAAGSCGDGTIDPGEECDDGPDLGEGFACLDDCTLNVCGDGVIGPAEGCDDGNTNPGDGCDAVCLIEDPPPEAIFCGNKIYECGDTLDNDMDGLIDLDDPECTTPCDDDEGSFKTNLPGENEDCKADCYFDANSGLGDDKCSYSLECDPENPGEQLGCEYDFGFADCQLQQPKACHDQCMPVMPNGCDCFGCCEFGDKTVYLNGSSECTLDALINEPEKCESCTINPLCVNSCEPDNCEVCFGQTADDLDPMCPEPECPGILKSCFNDKDCEQHQFCQTGCCVTIL
jgi:cysteine-rich repeat protein